MQSVIMFTITTTVALTKNIQMRVCGRVKLCTLHSTSIGSWYHQAKRLRCESMKSMHLVSTIYNVVRRQWTWVCIRSHDPGIHSINAETVTVKPNSEIKRRRCDFAWPGAMRVIGLRKFILYEKYVFNLGIEKRFIPRHMKLKFNREGELSMANKWTGENMKTVRSKGDRKIDPL